MRSALERKLRRVARLCHSQLFLDQLAWALAWAGMVAAAAVAAERALAFAVFRPWMLGVLVGAAVLAAGGLWVLRRPSRMEVALLVDDRLCLRERFSTALALASSEDPFAVAACTEAREAAERLDLRDEFRVRPSRRWLYPVLSWSAAAAVIAFLPTLDLLGYARRQRSSQEEARRLEQARAEVKQVTDRVNMTVQQMGDKDLSSELSKLGEMKDALKAEDVKRQAIRKLDELAERLKKLQGSEKMESLKEMQEMLKGVRSPAQGLSSELNRSVAKGDFQQAAAILKELLKQIEEGKLSAQQKEALAKQLDDLGKQLEDLAAKDKNLQDELQKAGLDKDLAKLDDQKLREALEKQGLTKEQIEELMQKAAACRSAGELCRKLGQAMSACGSHSLDGQITEAELVELVEQLDELEGLAEELAGCAASLDEIGRAIALLGEGEGDQGGTGEFSEGLVLTRTRGKGTGGPGIGAGPRPTDEGGKTGLQKTRAASPSKDGPAVASWYFKGSQVKGESKRDLKEVIQAGKDAAAEAISENEIPRRYEGSVKKYFGELEEAGKSEK